KAVVGISRSNALVLHVPISWEHVPKNSLSLGEYKVIFPRPKDVVPLVNTSRASSSEQALGMAEQGMQAFEGPIAKEFSFAPLLKLEVLDKDLSAIDIEVIRTLRQLPQHIVWRSIPL